MSALIIVPFVYVLNNIIDNVQNDDNMDGPHGEVTETSPACAGVEQEISKMTLIGLAKSSLEAQFANTQYNTFTGFLAGKVNMFHHEGKVIILTY